ncbi:sulfatase family protein [Microbacterium sp. YY-01]|uniref:sulfatase family protein n=1 Tax=Microbacterium sp. YY-01 TaxID=3421634 RepID=UPI003D16B4CD
MNRPNIVFILVDDHAPHAISAYGSVVNSTPNIDRLAHEGARLDAMFCTNSICTPSRASILTGTYSHVNGVPSIFSEMDYRVPTFVDVLHEQGYATALFGKWHLGESQSAQPRNFDEWLVFPGQGDYNDPLMIGPNGEQRMAGYATDIVTDLALDWLERRNNEQPFALFVHHKAPHSPWVPDPKHSHLYPVGSIPEPETLHDDHASLGTWVSRTTMSIADDLTKDYIPDEVPQELLGDDKRRERASWKYQRYMRNYLQCIQSIDDNVKRVLDGLDDAGIAEDTIVVYCSDQGFFLGDHGWFDKRLMFEQSLQMPTLFRYPRSIRPGTAVENIVTNIDFADTLLELCGIDVETALPSSQGTSFAPLLRGEEVHEWATSMYYRYWEHDDPNHHVSAHYGVRTLTHKLICYYNDGLGVPGASSTHYPMEWELFDLEKDPAELHNVIDDPAYTQILADLRGELARLQKHYGDEPYNGPGTPHPEWAEGFQQFS